MHSEWAAKAYFIIFISVSQHWAHPNASFATSLTQITALRCPSVYNTAWSEHTICFCFIPIIFPTRFLNWLQVQLRGWRLSAIPPGCYWGIKWSPVPFLTVLEEPLGPTDWGRKPCSVMKWGVGTGSDIQELKKQRLPCTHPQKPKIPVLFIWRRRKWEGKVSHWEKQQ